MRRAPRTAGPVARWWPARLMLLGLAGLLAGCSGGGPAESGGGNSCPVTSVSLSSTEQTIIGLGAEATLRASLLGQGGPLSGTDASVTWRTDAPAVVSVQGTGTEATVRTIAPGTARITASTCGGSAVATITVSAPDPAFTMLTAGDLHTCALTSSGQGYCWGANLGGSLGDGTRDARWAPTPVAGGLTWAALVAGDRHTCGLTTAGAAYCWSRNDGGEVGNGEISYGGTVPVTPTQTPTRVAGGHTFRSLGAGYFYTCGITTAGQALCWGGNLRGQLGDGTDVVRTIPTPVAGGHAFSSVVPGKYHTCGLTTAGQALCWGRNDVGQLGGGTTRGVQLTPVPVTGGHTFAAVTVGEIHTCGLTPAGQALCWGDNTFAQLGDGTDARRAEPRPVAGGHTFRTVIARATETCGLTTSGRVLCWGGSQAFGHPTRVLTPTAVAGDHTFSALTIGDAHRCGLTTAGVTLCWGSNDYGQLGVGAAGGRAAPAPVVRPRP